MPFSVRTGRAPAVATPDIRQGEHAECGLAALAILLGHHGVHLSLAKLRRRAGTTLFGTTLRQLRDLARAQGFEATARRIEPEALVACGLPLIAHMSFIHFTVVEAVSRQGVHVNDPAEGPKILTHAEFSRAFTGIVLSLRPATATPRGTPFSFRTALRHALSQEEPRIAATLCLSAASGAAATLGLWRLATEESMGITAGLLLAAPLATAASFLIMQKACLGAWERARRRLADALRGAEDSHYLFARPGRTLNLFTALEGLQAPAVPAGARACFWLLAATLTGIALAPAAVLPVAALSLAQALVLLRAARRRGGWIERFGEGSMPVEGVDPEFLADPRPFRIGRNGDALFTRLAGLHALALSQAVKTAQARYGLESAAFAFDLARLAAPFATAPGRAETVLALALAAASSPLLRKIERGLHIKPLKEALLRLEDLPPAPDRSVQTNLPDESGLLFHDAGWSPPQQAPVLTGLSLRVRPGEVLAVHGAPGCGLTSFARLAGGLLAPSAGSVGLDGRPPGRGSAILVDRHCLVVTGTVRDNLRLGNDAIGEGTMRAALALVELEETLAPRGGLDCALREDRPGLSGGQLRRLALARALCRAPRLLVLDEALDAMETDLARAILARLRKQGFVIVLTTGNRDLLATADLTLDLGGGS